jgi:uncharacterized phage-associated protein
MPAVKAKLNKEKFKQVLHYIVDSCKTKDNIGKVALFKLLYFSDFNFYEIHEKSITNETYVKLPKGPAPRHFDEIVKEMEKEGKVKSVSRKFMGKTQYALISLRQPDLSELTAPEIKTIDLVIGLLSSMNATQVSEFSHGDMPWKATKDMEEIDYELVFYRNDLYSVRGSDAD